MNEGPVLPTDRLAFTSQEWSRFDHLHLARLEGALGLSVEELLARDWPGDAEQASMLLCLAMLSPEEVDTLESLFVRAIGKAAADVRAAA